MTSDRETALREAAALIRCECDMEDGCQFPGKCSRDDVNAILALIDQPPPASAATVVDDAIVDRFEAALASWARLMKAAGYGLALLPSRASAREILTETLTEPGT